jgi:glycosyltransferase involved in cell wall biosynthesis
VTAPIRSVHIDIEGGFGGSSRSLFELVSRLDRDKVCPLVICRTKGPIQQRYEDIGIKAIHVPEIYSFAPRDRNNWKIFAVTAPRLLKLRKAVQKIVQATVEHRAQIVHLNYEGLFLLGTQLRRQLDLPIVGHSRTRIPSNLWGRWEARTLAGLVSHMFYISPEERDAFLHHAHVSGDVIWNIAAAPPQKPTFPKDPVAVYLGNIDYEKGADRLIDVAAELENQKAMPQLRIAVFGSARSGTNFLEDLRDQVKARGLTDRIEFKGHTPHPERELQSALCLLRVSRWNDPWGRDVIEATRSGIPALATGTTNAVIEHQKTGYLFADFDASQIASTMIDLATNAEKWQEISDCATRKGEEMFSGKQQVDRVMKVFTALTSEES